MTTNDTPAAGKCHGLKWLTVENSFYPRTKPCPGCEDCRPAAQTQGPALPLTCNEAGYIRDANNRIVCDGLRYAQQIVEAVNAHARLLAENAKLAEAGRVVVAEADRFRNEGNAAIEERNRLLAANERLVALLVDVRMVLTNRDPTRAERDALLLRLAAHRAGDV